MLERATILKAITLLEQDIGGIRSWMGAPKGRWVFLRLLSKAGDSLEDDIIIFEGIGDPLRW